MSLSITQVGRSFTSHLVVTATGTGTTTSYPFVKPSLADNADLLVATAIVTGVFSALVFELQISTDNGVTWTNVTSWDAHATPSTTFEIAENILYRFNCTTFTGGTSVEVYASTTSFDTLLTTAYSNNKFLASPADGSSGALTPRIIAGADIPSLAYVPTVVAPSHHNSSGTAGQFSFDSTHIYFCLATNSWLQISSSGVFSTSF